MGNYPYSNRSNHADFGPSLEWQRLPEVGADRYGAGGPAARRLMIAGLGMSLVGVIAAVLVLYV